MTTNGESTTLSSRWYLAEREGFEVHEVLDALVYRLRQRIRPRKDMYQMLTELYGGSELSGLGLTNYDKDSQIFHPASLPYNVIRSAVDTLVNKIGKEKPRPFFLTDRANLKQRKRAKMLQKFMDGLFAQLELYKRTPWIFRDACLFGTGCLMTFRRGDHIFLERVFPWECLVDLADARYGDPKNFYLCRYIDKSVLADMFPEFEEEIEACSIQTDDVDHVQDPEANVDRVMLTEAWHLPSGPDAKDGRHAVIIRNATLVDEGYEKHYVPIVFMKYKEPIIGFWGDGLGQEMQGWQTEVNEVADRVQQAHYMTGGQFWLVPDGADIVDTELANGIGVVIHHKMGMKPENVNPEPIAQGTYQYLKDLPDLALKFSGISQMSAQGTKDPGITAAKAIQTMSDIESDRFSMLGIAYEDFHLTLCDRLIDLCKEIDEEHPGYSIRTGLKDYSIQIKWSEVDMERDAFVMQLFPTRLLAKTPAARMQQLQDLFAAGIIDRAVFMKLIEAPDLGAEQDLESAGRDIVDDQIEQMIDCEDPDAPGAMIYPEPFMDLIFALHRAQANYNLGKMQGMDEGHLRLLSEYMRNCKALLDMQAPPPPPPNGGLPGGNPLGDPAGATPLVGQPLVAPPMPGQPGQVQPVPMPVPGQMPPGVMPPGSQGQGQP